MSKLLKDAIADAKAVKATALANAKAALEETFQPTLQRMISSRLAEEGELEDEEGEVPAAPVAPVAPEEPVDAVPAAPAAAPAAPAPVEPAPEEDPDELDLEAIIRELEGEPEDPAMAAEEPSGDDLALENLLRELELGEGEEEGYTTDDPADINSIDELLRELEGDEPVEDPASSETEVKMENVRLRRAVKKAKAELQEAYEAITTLKSAINEVNLLNSKLMYSSKIIRNYDLNESQQLKVLENFDRANNIREVKLVYSTLAENFRGFKKDKKFVTEAVASKPIQSAKPTKAQQNPEFSFVPRWQQLAGLKSVD
jgi:hypothetical protein